MPQKNEPQLECIRCGTESPINPLRNNCEKCGGTLEYKVNLPKQDGVKFSGTIRFWRYKQLLPPVSNMVSLGEGATPLHKAERLAKTVGAEKSFT